MKALIVEDNALNTLVLRRALERLGFSDLVVVEGKQDNLSEYLKPSYDLALVEWMLPQTSGAEVVRQLKSCHAGAAFPIIVISEKFQHEDVLEAMELGVEAFLVKPIRPEVLMDRVRKVMKLA